MSNPGPNRDSMPYRECVGLVVFNAKGQVFLGQRKGKPDKKSPGGDTQTVYAWQFPQGGIDKGEAPYTAALRELYEETSIRSVSLLAEADEWIIYDLPAPLLGKALKGKYRGQRQKWFALLFKGDPAEIDVKNPAGGTHPAEFSDWRWSDDFTEVADLIVPFKREAYQAVIKTFAHLPEQLRTASK